MKAKWTNLKPLQIGQYAEYYIKMMLTIHEFDVFTSEVDDKGIDFICRHINGSFWEIQVKSIRTENSNYIFQTQEKFDITNKNLFLAVVMFTDNQEPNAYLINSQEWNTPNELIKFRTYQGLRSKPEYGLNISEKNIPLLEEFSLEKIVKQLNLNK